MLILFSTSVRLMIGFLLLIGIAPLIPARAQNTISGTIIGNVRNRKNNEPLPDARVRVLNTANGRVRTTRTNSQGEYRLPFLPEGRYTITASKDGYLPESEPLTNFVVYFGQYNLVKHNPQTKKYHWLSVNFRLSQPTLKGQAQDRDGQTLAGALVTVKSQRGSVTRAVLTDQDGGYQIPDLPPGYYQISASWNGESAASLPVLLDREEVWAPAITIPSATGGEAGLVAPDPRSAAATAASSVPQRSPVPAPLPAPVKEETGLSVHLIDATRSAYFSEQQISSLPLGGATSMRTFDDLALLVVGVAPSPYTPGARGPGVGFGVGTAGQFSVNGMRARSNNFSVDGSDNNDADVGVRRQGFVGLVPQSVESVGALSVVTLLWDAELGRNAGGQINAVSKYGVNEFHGQAYGFFTDSRLNARNFFDYTGGASGGKDPFTRTQVGGVIGGPVIEDRLHLFASFEREQVNASTEQHFATPANDERRFVDLRGLGFTDGDRFGALNSGAVQNFTRQTPLGVNILSLYPAPNTSGGPFGANTFTQVLPADGEGLITSLRLTQQFPESHTFNFRRATHSTRVTTSPATNARCRA